MVHLFVFIVAITLYSTAGLQEGEGGSLPRAKTTKPCNRCRIPSRHEDPTFPCTPQFPRPLLLSAMDPRKVNPQATYSCRTTVRMVPASSPLSPALLRSTFRSLQTGNRPNKTVTMLERNRMLAIKRMTGCRRWYQQSKTHRCRLPQTAQVLCRTEGFRSRTETRRRSLAFGRSSPASVRDVPRCPTIYALFSPGFLVIYHITQT